MEELNYNIPILNKSNWCNFSQKLSEYPIRISCFDHLQSAIQVADIGFKYVFQGSEFYAFNHKGYSLNSGQYILGNKNYPCEVAINGSRSDWGICIDLSSQQIRQLLYSMYYPNALDDLDVYQSFYFSDELFQQACHSGVRLKSSLHALMSTACEGNGLLNLNDAMQHFTWEILNDQKELIKAYSRLQTVKDVTRNEQWKRLQKVVSILRDSICSEVSMTHVASQVALSEFRLFHLFKQAFGISPYQYLLRERMRFAVNMRKVTSLSWSEIAVMIGFAEPTSFRKAFKRIFGVSPTNFELEMSVEY